MPTVLVTGTSKGIGFETALAFARAGHRVAATMRSPDNSPELAAIAAREKLPITVSTMDVDSDASVRDGIARSTKELGQIDVLVNNAGIERTGSVEELPMSDFRDVMETNYFGAIRCIKAVLPSMRQRRSGTIINVTSIAGVISIAPMAPYAASKFALEALSESLAQEVKAFNIRVAMIEPGITDTPMARHLSIDALPSPYPQKERMAALYKAVLQQPIPPTIAAEKILEVATNGTWQLRHLVGADAVPFVGWRRAMSDEQWADFGALSDEAWFARVEADFGINARSAAAAR